MACKAYPKLLEGLNVEGTILSLASLTLLTTKLVNKEQLELLNNDKSHYTWRKKKVDISWMKDVSFSVINDIEHLLPESSRGFFRVSFS